MSDSFELDTWSLRSFLESLALEDSPALSARAFIAAWSDDDTFLQAIPTVLLAQLTYLLGISPQVTRLPVILLLAIIAPLAVAGLRLTHASPKGLALANALVTILGVASVLLILYRIIYPPAFYVETTITSEGAVQPPIFLALLSAAGIALGRLSGVARRKHLPPGLRGGCHREQARIA